MINVSKYEGFNLTLKEWKSRLTSGEYAILADYKVIEPHEKLSSREVCEILNHEDGVYYGYQDFSLFVQRVYDILLV